MTAGPPPPSPPGRLRSAIIWSYLQTGAQLGMTTIVTFVLAAVLGPRAFGIIALGLAPAIIVQTMLVQPLIVAIIQREELDDDHLHAGFWVALLGSFAAAALVAVASPLWAAYNDLPELTTVCLALTPLILLQGATVIPEAVLRRDLAFRTLAVRSLVSAVAGGVVGVVAALMGAGVWALVAQQLVAAVAGTIALWAVAGWRPKPRLRRSAVRDLAGFATHSSVGAAGYMFVARADMLIMGAFFGPVAVGLFRLANRLPDLLMEVTVRSLQQVSLPDLARLQRDRAAFTARLANLLHGSAALGLPALGILAGCAGPLVGLLGPDWAPAAVAMQLLCIAAAVNLIGSMLAPTLQAVGRPGLLAAFAWAHGLLTIGGLALAGTLFRRGDVAEDLAVITLAKIAADLIIVTVAVVIVFRAILKVSVHRVVGRTVPAALAGLVAYAAVEGLQWAFDLDGPPLLALIGNGAFAVTVGAAVLFVVDARIAALVRQKVRRVRAGGLRALRDPAVGEADVPDPDPGEPTAVPEHVVAVPASGRGGEDGRR